MRGSRRIQHAQRQRAIPQNLRAVMMPACGLRQALQKSFFPSPVVRPSHDSRSSPFRDHVILIRGGALAVSIPRLRQHKK